jgi:hypothetical protein
MKKFGATYRISGDSSPEITRRFEKFAHLAGSSSQIFWGED